MLHQQDAALAQERKNLSDSSEISRIAREQYQLVSPGQQAFEVLPKTGSSDAEAPYSGDPGLSAPGSAVVGLRPPAGFGTTTTQPAKATPAVAAHQATDRAPRHSAARCGRAHAERARILAVTTDSRAPAGSPSPADLEAVTGLLGRVPNGNFTVVVRRRDGRPVVIANDPHLRDGEPMPTRYWLVDPEIRALVGRLESHGGVRTGRERRRRRGAAERPRPLRRGARRLDPGRLARAAAARRGGRHAPRREVPARPCGLVAGRRRRPGRPMGERAGGAPRRATSWRHDARRWRPSTAAPTPPGSWWPTRTVAS